MNYSDPQLQSRLAAEYVLGTLRGRARRRFERLLLAGEPGLQEATDHWQRRLNPLAETLPPMQPPPSVWRGIRRRIARPDAGRPSWIHRAWESTRLWRGLGFASLALLVVYGVATIQYQNRLEKARPTQYVAVLHDQGARPTVVASLTGDGRTLKLDMLSRGNVPEGKVMQIWCLPEGKDQPISMGMLKNSSVQFELSAEQLNELQQGGEIVVSIEPSGGSPVDRPSGPVKYRGRII